ncbi:cytochrome b [Luedemannella helvata]|uniref:Cytochrome b561 bacterial/Ni-hydrogenase domain-containing protein n=1 Tax=Luedemannella helvata TaxID=349315 RepID=A0ABP4X1A9_9ACTN
MPLLNGTYGYGLITKSLHWLTVMLVAAQFVVGYTMVAGAGGGPGRGGDSSPVEPDRRGEGGERFPDGVRPPFGEPAPFGERPSDGVGFPGGERFGERGGLLPVHVMLGLLIIAVALVRLAWRRATPLPPWAPHLTAGERRWLHASEVSLLTMLIVMPATGLLLVFVGGGLVPLHIAAHVLFFVALAAHVGLVARRRLLRRML